MIAQTNILKDENVRHPNVAKTGGVTDVNMDLKTIAPVIISASRRTDIPAFHGDCFFESLNDGHLIYNRPFGTGPVRVSFENVRLVTFWTKNPAPIIGRLNDLDQRGIGYYFQFTVNDYEAEGLEPGIPKLQSRIDTFRGLAERIGRERVIWRFDPLIVTDKITPDILIDKVNRIAQKLSGHTNKLVISFFKPEAHKKADRKLVKAGIAYRGFSEEEVAFVAKALAQVGHEYNLTVAACAEQDLSQYGIRANKCVDDELMRAEFGQDKALMDYLDMPLNLKAPGQRKACQCVSSEDIGEYNTCSHHCRYCYANVSETAVERKIGHQDRLDRSVFPRLPE